MRLVYEIASGTRPAALSSPKAPSARGTSPALAHASMSALKAARSGEMPASSISRKTAKTGARAGGTGVVASARNGWTTPKASSREGEGEEEEGEEEEEEEEDPAVLPAAAAAAVPVVGEAIRCRCCFAIAWARSALAITCCCCCCC